MNRNAARSTTSAAVHVFLGDPAVVDPLVHALVDETMAAESQALDFEIFRFGERSLGELEAALRQVGMFSSRRCVWLRGFVEPRRRSAADGDDADEDGSGAEDGEAEEGSSDLLAVLEGGIPEGTTLAVSAAALDARGRLFKWLSKNAEMCDRRVAVEQRGQRGGQLGEAGLKAAIQARLRELGVTAAGAGVVDAIAQRSGTVLGETLQEVDRLVLSQDDPTRLEVADVHAGMRDLALGWVFDLTKALEARDLGKAEELVAGHLAAGEAPLRLSALLATFFGELMTARPLVDRLPPGALKMKGQAFVNGPGASLPDSLRGWKGYFRLQAAARFRPGELERLHREALQLDMDLKRSPASPLLLFSRLLQKTCIPGAASP